MDKEHLMKDAMHVSMMELHESQPSIDDGTAALIVLQQSMAGLLQASLVVSNNLRTPEQLDVLGMVSALTQILDFICDTTERLHNGTK